MLILNNYISAILKVKNFSEYVKLHDLCFRNVASHIPQDWLLSHTMLDALYYYVCQKFPMEAISRLLREKACVEIHGTYPTSAETLLSEKGYKRIGQIPFSNNVSQKRFNSVRPAFFEAENPDGHKCFVVAVTPGADYIAHYTSMVQYILAMKGFAYSTKTFVFRYPEIEKRLCDWSEFDHSFVSEGDRVVLGYVEELQKNIEDKTKGLVPIQEKENAYYASCRYKISSDNFVNFLGVKFSYWGNVSAELTRHVCAHGASEVLYLSKVGALSSSEDVYSRIFVPTKYMVMRNGDSVFHVNIENSMAKNHALQEGHVSVPTVLEETFHMREMVKNEGACSIDNEAAQIAEAIQEYNTVKGRKPVLYGSAHFATDYLHENGNGKKNIALNLCSNRTPAALSMKKAAINKLAQKLLCHFGLEPVQGVFFSLPSLKGPNPPQL